jgi:hypothetical protein
MGVPQHVPVGERHPPFGDRFAARFQEAEAPGLRREQDTIVQGREPVGLGLQRQPLPHRVSHGRFQL